MAARYQAGMVAVVAALVAVSTTHAQSTLPQPVLNTIYPPVLQAGASTVVTVAGTTLEGATRLHFSLPGIECKSEKPNEFRITVPKLAPEGYADVRVVTPRGISNPRGLAITRLPVVEMKEATLKASLGQAVWGRATKQDRKTLSFDAKKGSAVQVLCQPWLLDSRLEPVLELRDAQEHALGRLNKEGVLNHTPAADGQYSLVLNDLMFGGGDEYPFVLTLASPAAGGLAPNKPLQPTEKLDADLNQPQPVNGVFVGWFAERGKARRFTFQAKKGDALIIDVRCARLGLNADPFFIVEKVDGEKTTFIAEANDRTALAAKDEFDPGWADPSYRFEAKEDGVYQIKLRNLFGTREPFELSVQSPGTAFELVAIPSEPPPAAKKTAAAIAANPLWRGGVAAFKVVAMRERGYTGPITLSVEGLPAGVTCPGAVIGEGRDSAVLCLKADEKAEPWAGAIRIIGKADQVLRTARGATVVRAVADTAKAALNVRFTREVVLGVVASNAPVLVEPESAQATVTTTGKVSVPLKVTRRDGLNDALKLTLLGLPVTTAVTADIAAKASTGKLELDAAKLKLPAGDFTLVLQGTVKFKPQPDGPKDKPKEVTAVVHSLPITLHVTKETAK